MLAFRLPSFTCEIARPVCGAFRIDDLYLVPPYYIVPDGKVGHGAFAVIRETILPLPRVVLTLARSCSPERAFDSL